MAMLGPSTHGTSCAAGRPPWPPAASSSPVPLLSRGFCGHDARMRRHPVATPLVTQPPTGALVAHMCSSTAVPPETVTCQHPSPTPWRCLISPHAPSQRPRGIPHLYRLFRTAFKGHPFMRSTSCPPPAGGPSQYSHARQARPHSPCSPGPGVTAVLQGGRTRGCSRRSLSAPCTSFPPPASSRRSASQRSASCSAASAA